MALAAAVAWAFHAAWDLGGHSDKTSGMTIHGWIALSIAFVGTAVVGGGLMWLAFYSSRRGFDDRVGPEGENES
jgi:hypothetical protein